MDWVPVIGNSMSPALVPDQQVAIDWFAHGASSVRPQKGDLVVHRSSDGTLILHRVIREPEAENFYWVTKGDKARVADRLQENEIWGRVIALRRKKNESILLWRNTSLDRLIAELSWRSLDSTPLQGVVYRFIIRGLGWVRRCLN